MLASSLSTRRILQSSSSTRLSQLSHQILARNMSSSTKSHQFSQPIAIIQGVGPGTGASVARKFAAKYPVVLLSRTEKSYKEIVDEINSSGGFALGIPTDVGDKDSVAKAFEQINTLGENGGKPKVAAAVLNGLGSFVKKPFLDLTYEDFVTAYDAPGRGTFLFAHHVLPLLLASKESAKDSHPPTLIFTGATASVKGSAQFGSFAAGKWAARALSQSLAREFGPQGVHVAHAVIDGVIDIPRTKEWMKDQPDAKISPEAIADAYWHLHTQPRTSFTYEIDIRPYIEKW